MYLMDMKGVMAATGFSETTIRRMEKAGTLPRSKLFGRRRYWKTADIKSWVDQQMDDRGANGTEKSKSWLAHFA